MSDTYKIESGIPIPPDPEESPFPFAEMKCGDSFFAKFDSPAPAAANSYAVIHDWRFAFRPVIHPQKGWGIRTWRIR